uniref:Rhodanese domain-containing protein n=1 Tax=Thermorudis peleae TaxID=1382356 RepID=A0A831TAP4_9BACT
MAAAIVILRQLRHRLALRAGTVSVSRFAARRAQQMGYASVFVMRAGIRGWQEASKPVERG